MVFFWLRLLHTLSKILLDVLFADVFSLFFLFANSPLRHLRLDNRHIEIWLNNYYGLRVFSVLLQFNIFKVLKVCFDNPIVVQRGRLFFYRRRVLLFRHVLSLNISFFESLEARYSLALLQNLVLFVEFPDVFLVVF